MARTVLDLIKTACYRSGGTAPASLSSGAPTDAYVLKLLHLFYSVGEELRALANWPQLKRTKRIYLVEGQSRYSLPLNFYASLPFTHYDQSNQWGVLGPLSDGEWNLDLYGITETGERKKYRIFGVGPVSGGGEFQILPTPGAGDVNTVISFDYYSRDWLLPPHWTASESIAQNTFRNAGGIIYKKTDSGSESTGTVAPTMEYGEGQDGSVRWLALSTSAWQSTTVYSPGDYRTNGGNLYFCRVGGTSAGSGGPSGTTEETDITDGTVTWRYMAAPSRTSETDYSEGDHILISAQYYRCVQAGRTGKNAPTWDLTTFTDNAVTWTHQTAAYEAIQGDTDICVFDDELMIAGLRAEYFQGLGMGSADLVGKFERLKLSAMGRMNAGAVLDLTSAPYSPPVPRVPDGSWSF